MQSSASKHGRTGASSIIAAALALVSVIGLICAAALAHPGIFALEFNTFGFISLIVTLMNVLIVVLILRIKSHTDDIQWFLLYISALIFFGASQVLQACSVYPAGALFWEHLGGVGIVIMPAALFLFVKYYSRARKDIAIWLTPLMGICWGVLSFFYATALIVPAEYGYKFRWGYYSIVTPEPGYGVNALWFGAMTILTLTLLFRFYRSAVNPILKKQSLIYMLAVSFPAVVALFMDGILPAFGIGYSIPPLGLMFTTISVALIYHGITRYRLFRLNPQVLAENVLNTMEEGIIVTSYDLHIETVNPQAEKILGKKDSEIKSKHIVDYFPAESWAKIADNDRGVTTQRGILGLTIHGEDGKLVPVRVSASILQEDRRIMGYVFAIADITELKDSYDALEKEKESVEHKVDVRTKKLREAQERLAETDKIKTEFVTLTSHNLRTPLTVIRGNIELLTESPLNDDQNKFVSSLEASAKRLGTLIEELLTISRIEAGDHAALEVAPLQSVLEPLVQEAESLAATSHNAFKFEAADENALLNVNVPRLQAAIINLLDNAFKFTKEGEVKLTASVNGDTVKIIVSDNGIGISDDEKPKLFTKFHRSTGDGPYGFDYVGQGLGLYFAKLIVTEHVGHIDVKSRLGQGTTVTVTLPRYTEDLLQNI